jgi:hypothetical protein
MTNDTIDHDVGVTQAAAARLPGHAAVRADLDTHPHADHAPSTWAPAAMLSKVGVSRTAMTADKPSQPLGVGSTHRWTAQPAT